MLLYIYIKNRHSGLQLANITKRKLPCSRCLRGGLLRQLLVNARLTCPYIVRCGPGVGSIIQNRRTLDAEVRIVRHALALQMPHGTSLECVAYAANQLRNLSGPIVRRCNALANSRRFYARARELPLSRTRYARAREFARLQAGKAGGEKSLETANDLRNISRTVRGIRDSRYGIIRRIREKLCLVCIAFRGSARSISLYFK